MAFEGLSVHLQPVEILGHPIDRQVYWHSSFGECDDDLRMADLHLVAAFGNIRSLDSQIYGIHPEDDVRVRVKVQGLYSLLAEDDFSLLALRCIQRDDVVAICEQQAPGSRRLADARDIIDRVETWMTSALVRSYIN